MATGMSRRNLLHLLIGGILALAAGGCGKTPAELEEERFRVILHRSDRTLDRDPLVYYLNERHGAEADRLINHGMLRWAAAHRSQWPALMMRLKSFRTEGITRAAEEISP